MNVRYVILITGLGISLLYVSQIAFISRDFILSYIERRRRFNTTFIMSVDTDISIVALIISLTALVCSTAQLLCQYLATADGYRRCKKAVMGPWARETCLRWHWKQFRFETIFTVPEIILWDGVEESTDFASRIEIVNGSPSSQDRTHVAPAPIYAEQIHEEKVSGQKKLVFTNRAFKTLDPQAELVCWLGMLEALHEHEADIEGLRGYKSSLPTPEQPRPAVTFRRRSWDFQSSDTIRPHAVSNLFYIAVLVHRLGMTWQDFRKWLNTYSWPQASSLNRGCLSAKA